MIAIIDLVYPVWSLNIQLTRDLYLLGWNKMLLRPDLVLQDLVNIINVFRFVIDSQWINKYWSAICYLSLAFHLIKYLQHSELWSIKNSWLPVIVDIRIERLTDFQFSTLTVGHKTEDLDSALCC